MTRAIRIGACRSGSCVIGLVVLAACSASSTGEHVIGTGSDPGTTVVTTTTEAQPVADLWHFDWGTIGVPAAAIGDRNVWMPSTIAAVSDEPVTVLSAQFPDLPPGVTITHVGLIPEDRPESVGSRIWPSGAMELPVELPPNADLTVDDPFSDPRFFAVAVEAEIVAAGKWSIGAMYLTYRSGGRTYTVLVALDAGNVCTTPAADHCVPGLDEG